MFWLCGKLLVTTKAVLTACSPNSLHRVQLFRSWPLKNVLINSKRPEFATCDGQRKAVQHASYFGDVKHAAESLGMPNRLSGYVFVVDAEGRIRWRESGKMLDGQGDGLVDAVQTLIHQSAPR